MVRITIKNLLDWRVGLSFEKLTDLFNGAPVVTPLDIILNWDISSNRKMSIGLRSVDKEDFKGLSVDFADHAFAQSSITLPSSVDAQAWIDASKNFNDGSLTQEEIDQAKSDSIDGLAACEEFTAYSRAVSLITSLIASADDMSWEQANSIARLSRNALSISSVGNPEISQTEGLWQLSRIADYFKARASDVAAIGNSVASVANQTAMDKALVASDAKDAVTDARAELTLAEQQVATQTADLELLKQQKVDTALDAVEASKKAEDFAAIAAILQAEADAWQV